MPRNGKVTCSVMYYSKAVLPDKQGIEPCRYIWNKHGAGETAGLGTHSPHMIQQQ